VTPDQRLLVASVLTQVLQDNLGNRLTVSLANGILGQVDQTLTSPPEPPPEVPPKSE
jgi:hypothetical protein